MASVLSIARSELWLPVLLLSAALGLAAEPERVAIQPIGVVARAVPLDVASPERITVGRLVYRGGVEISGDDPRFGGWSDVWIAPSGERLVAISDRGYWFEARLKADFRDGPLALEAARLGPLLDQGGAPLSGGAADAEALAALPDHGYLVGFERQHRLWRYPPADPPFSVPPAPVVAPPGLDSAPFNAGLEALVHLGEGRLLAIAEGLGDGATRVGWLFDGREWHGLGYAPAPDFSPTGATRAPNGDVLVLERRYTRRDGVGARIVRLPAAAIRQGADLMGEELARLEAPLTLDNFEGIAARRGSGGETLIYLLSDDNYSLLQRTLLLVFSIAY